MKALTNKFNKNQLVDKEKIINYEYTVLDQGTRSAQPTFPHSEKYSIWSLEQKIAEIIGQHPHSVRWMGNSQTAYLETYAYILLIGSGHSAANFLQFKHVIYKIGKNCLSVSQQKMLVEFLCLIEYSRDRYSFLSKYPEIETVFLKLLRHLEKEHTIETNVLSEIDARKEKVKVRSRNLTGKATQNKGSLQSDDGIKRSGTSLSIELQSERQLEQIYRHFNHYFNFINVIDSNEYCCVLKLFNLEKIYVVVEKGCFFMVQFSPDLPMEEHLTFGQNKGHRTIVSELEDIMNNESTINNNYDPNAKIEFDKGEFEQIFNYQNGVVQSSVRLIDKGEEIKTPKLKPPPSSPTVRIIEAVSHDHTFIDDLLFAHPESDSFKRDNKVKSVKSAKMQVSLKGITTIKEELKKVRSKIEDKIRKMDKNYSLKTLNPSASINLSSKPSNSNFYKHDKNMKRSNSHSNKYYFPKNTATAESFHKGADKQRSSMLLSEKEKTHPMLGASPIKSNIQLIESKYKRPETLKELSLLARKSSKDESEVNISKHFNFNVNVNISNIKGKEKSQLKSQHSCYPLPPERQISSIPRYPSQSSLLPGEQFHNDLSTKIKYPNFLKKQQPKNPETNISFCKGNAII